MWTTPCTRGSRFGWIANHNGYSEADELEPLAKHYTMIGTSYTETNLADKHGNEYRYKGWAEARTAWGRNVAETGRKHQERLTDIYDVFFVQVR